MKALHKCDKIAQSLQYKTIIRFRLTVFLFKSLNVFNLSAATKNLRTNYIFFVKPTCLLLIQEKKAMTNF